MTTDERIVELYKQGLNFSQIGERIYIKGLANSEIEGMSKAFIVIKQALREGTIVEINEVENG